MARPSMRAHNPLLVLFFSISSSAIAAAAAGMSRADFPEGFIFGAASAAYQYEGAAREDGKGPSIWDTYALTSNGAVDGSIGNGEYHRFKEDVELLSELGMDAYRLSISWPRILPHGRGVVNQLGLDYYNNFIDNLLQKGIQPFVTLYHWDLPQALQDAYGGWLNHQIINDFANFAEICFREFGDRVKYWITFNEPNIFTTFGYNNGTFAPQRCSKYVGNCTFGDSAIEPYIVGHNVLLSHAKAVHIYKNKFQKKQGGTIGIIVNSFWYFPLYNGSHDALAIQRALDFTFGWFIDPIYYGDYPLTMREQIGARLPYFSTVEKGLLKDSIDFIGVNYYTSYFATDGSWPSNTTNKDYYTDMNVLTSGVRDGVPIGPLAASNWLYIVPQGIYKLLIYLKGKYPKYPIYITENGVDELNNATLPLEEALNDPIRINYHKDHLSHLNKAIRDGANVQGYFVWTFLDDFEWSSSYTVRFGLYYVDFKSLNRYAKRSVTWFKKFLSIE